MRTLTENALLTDAELERFGDFLKNCLGGRAMNVETLDDFFAELIAGPEVMMPSEYYPGVFDCEISDAASSPASMRRTEFSGSWRETGTTMIINRFPRVRLQTSAVQSVRCANYKYRGSPYDQSSILACERDAHHCGRCALPICSGY